MEMAGQIRELASSTLRESFRSYDPASARVILLDGAKQVLPPFGPELGAKTQKVLEKLGVEVQLESIVTDLDNEGLTAQGRRQRRTHRVGLQGMGGHKYSSSARRSPSSPVPSWTVLLLRRGRRRPEHQVLN